MVETPREKARPLGPPPSLDTDVVVGDTESTAAANISSPTEQPQATRGEPTGRSKPSAEAPGASEMASPLPSSWISASKSRREIPKAAKVGGAGVALLLVFVFALPRACNSASTTTKSTMITDNAAVGAELLRKRRHLTDDDFRSRGRRLVHVGAEPQPTVDALALEKRQRLRQNNPEDLRQVHKRAQGRAHSQDDRTNSAQLLSPPTDEPDMLVFFDNRASHSRRKASQELDALLLPAASTVRIALARDIVIHGGSTTVIAVVRQGEGLPEGTKLIGRATAGREGLVSIRFRSLVLPNGRSQDVDAEALDNSGSQMLIGTVTGGAKMRERSVARSVSSSAVERAAMAALGSGFLGTTARETVSESNRIRPPRSGDMVVTLRRDSQLEALFLRAVPREG